MKTWFITVLLVMLSTLPVTAQDAVDTAATVTKWSARQVPSETVDTIINRNMFVPDQRRAPRIEAPPADEGDAGGSDDPEPAPAEAHPEDPGRRFRLIGSSFSTGRWIAFIEQIDTTDIHRVAVNGEIANGTVATIDYDRIGYTVDGETRAVQIGRDLTGAEPVMPTTTYPGTDNAAPSPTAAAPSNNNGPPAASSDADARRAEVLRQLRERRERENQ